MWHHLPSRLRRNWQYLWFWKTFFAPSFFNPSTHISTRPYNISCYFTKNTIPTIHQQVFHFHMLDSCQYTVDKSAYKLIGMSIKLPLYCYTITLMNQHKLPFSVNLRSALSGLRCSLNSARLVNMRYGSLVPWVVRSSTRTPMYPSVRSTTNISSPRSLSTALTPATKPWGDKMQLIIQ